MRIIYLIGRYPELTNTFIDREIRILRNMGDFEISFVSIRRPLTLQQFTPEQKALYQETSYLLPERWRDFNFKFCVGTNLYFIFKRPKVYFRTLFELITGQHPSIKSRLLTILHLGLGVSVAYQLRNMKFDHLHVHFMDRSVVIALIVSRLLGKTYSFTAHAVDIYTKRVLMRLKLQNAQFVVTVSQYNREHLRCVAPDLPADKIHVLHPWVDPAEFSAPMRSKPNKNLHILSVGRLVQKKGHKDLILACRLLRESGVNLECRIIGDGPLRAELEALISQNELDQSIFLQGGQPQGQVQELLGRWADVFTLPCVIAEDGDRDGIPVSLAEAMAMELPVISTDIVGISELVQKGTGILVKPHDPEGLARALGTISTMSLQERAEMGRCGRMIIESEFNLIKGTKDLSKLFHTIVSENRTTGV